MARIVHHESSAVQTAIMHRKVRIDVKAVSARELFIEELERFRTVMAKNPDSLSIMLSVLEHAAIADGIRPEFIHRLEDFRQSLAERDRHHHRMPHRDLTEALDSDRGRAASDRRLEWESPTKP